MSEILVDQPRSGCGPEPKVAVLSYLGNGACDLFQPQRGCAMNENTERVKERIVVALTEAEFPPETARDIAFHITDWDHNLEDLIRVYDMNQEIDNDRVLDIVIEFLVHVPNHVAAAKKLIGVGPMEDIFEVGILEEDEDLKDG